MSIGIYAFLRIYFLSFGLSAFAQFRTHSTPSSPAAVPIAPARPVWYRVQTGAACPAFGRLSALVSFPPWFWHGLSCCLRCAVCPGALGAGVSTGGAYRERRGWGGSIVSVEKIQKRRFPFLPTPSFLRKTPYPLLSISKIPRKNKKTPRKGLCSVLYLPYKP